MDDLSLEKWIKNDEEGDKPKLHPYLDSLGHLTIGWGHNLENGIRPDEAELIFQNDLKQAIKELEQFSWYLTQPKGVKAALINMNFNLGITKLLDFHAMIHALIEKNYNAAATAALNSLWAKQVHHRANEIADMIKAGK